MFIPWQADEQCRADAYAEAERVKAEGEVSQYVVVDPFGKGQTVL